VAAQKGGCTKSTTCRNLATILAKEGYKVCAIDGDNKENTRFDNIDSMEDEILQLVNDGISVYVIPSSYIQSVYEDLIIETNGDFGNINEDFSLV
jgi:chromosome partitioning protein